MDKIAMEIENNSQILSSIKKAGGIYKTEKKSNMNDEVPFAIVFDYYGIKSDIDNFIHEELATEVIYRTPLIENGEEVGEKVEIHVHENELKKTIDQLYNSETGIEGKAISDDVGDVKIVNMVTDQEIEGLEQVRQFLNEKTASIKKAEENIEEDFNKPTAQTYEADAEDLILLADNEQDDYLRLIEMYKNLSRKKQRGVYDASLVPKLFMYLINDVAKKWYNNMKQWANVPGDVVLPVSRKVKEEAAIEMANRFEQVYEDEEYDFMKHKQDEEKKASKDNEIEYKGYTIREDADSNFRVKNSRGETTWAEPAATIETAKKWIDAEIIEKSNHDKRWENKKASINKKASTVMVDSNGYSWGYRGIDGTHAEYTRLGGNGIWTPIQINQIQPDIKKQLWEQGMIEGNFFTDKFYEKPEQIENKLASMKTASVELPGTNLELVGKGIDANGNSTVKVKFPNSQIFSIQTNQNLPGTKDILKGKDVNELTAEDLEVIRYELVFYVKRLGSDMQKKTLKIYGSKMASANNAYDVYLNGKKIDTVFFTYNDAVEDVKKSLVDHDGYDPSIVVKARSKMASINKVATTNEDVISMFLNDSFPKDKMPVWGTPNLKISKEPNGWSLINYSTRLLYRPNGDGIYFNTQKYSMSTSKIQNTIRNIAKENGISLQEVSEDEINGKINKMASIMNIPVELQSLSEKVGHFSSGDIFAKRIKLTKDEVTALKDNGFTRHDMGLGSGLPDLRSFYDYIKENKTASIKTASGWKRIVDGYEVEFYEEGGHNLSQITVRNINTDEYVFHTSDLNDIIDLIEIGAIDYKHPESMIKYLKDNGVIK